MKRAVLVILDGLRRDFVDAARTPHLAEFAARAEWFPAYRTAFPSATRVVTATLATGCHPARHTLQGNAMALLENGALVPHDAGLPDFLQHKRAVTGHSLAVPTLAERLAPHGGAIIYNNVSPGAAYAHDPDGHGHVYHRAGSFAPGRIALDPLNVELDAAGDRAMTERFIADALGQRQPALAVLWLGEPDHIQHNTVLGSPEHLAVLREADRHAGMAIAAVERRRAAGDDVLLIVGSDHGHETVSGVVDIEAELIAAGLKSATGPNDVIAVSSGTSSLIYLHPDAEAPPRPSRRLPGIAALGRPRDRRGGPRARSDRRRTTASPSRCRSRPMHRRTNSAFRAGRWPPSRAGASRTGSGAASTAGSASSSSHPCC